MGGALHFFFYTKELEMADLHRYICRQQFRRTVTVLAQNAQHSKTVAENDVLDMGDVDSVKALQTTLTQVGAGVDTNGQPLDEFDVVVRGRRNFEVDALDKQDARQVASNDTNRFGNAFDVISQSVTQVREKSGVSV